MIKDYIEEKVLYEIDNKKYTVVIKKIENEKSSEDLYELFIKYALERLKNNF